MNRVGSLPSRVVMLVLAASLVWLSACGDDSSAAQEADKSSATDGPDGREGTTTSTVAGDPDEPVPSAPLAAASDAPAAAGSGLTELPGPSDRKQFPDFGEVAIAITAASGDVTGWCALLAETADQRGQGLMGVEDLGGYKGMLFVHEIEQELSYWMKNTPMALSIAWFDDEGHFVSSADMEPFDEVCEHCRSEGPARFSLEVPQGELPSMGVGDGSTIQVGGDCA